MSKCFFLITLLLCAAAARAQTFSVDGDVRTIPKSAGEAQSTVVPPGKKQTCPNGRFLVTNDTLRPPTTGLVLGRDLDNTGGAFLEATFNEVPHPENYLFMTNDHDLVSLSNGDVLYLTAVWARGPLNPKPIWFDVTYRQGFGPGARSNLLAWRSTDCGKTFQYLSEFDPATVEDGICAYPQFPRIKEWFDVAGRAIFNMGGTDGQLVKVDPATDTLYMTFGCYGYYPKRSPVGRFELDGDKPLNKTLVAASDDKGVSWKSLGFVEATDWRLGIVPLEAGKLAFGLSTFIVLGEKNAGGKYDFNTAQQLFRTPLWGWSRDPQSLEDYIHANRHAHTVVARVPNSDSVMLAFPSTVTRRGRGHGYRVSFYDRVKKEYVEIAPVLPVAHNLDNYIVHLVAVDLGEGPVLLYWYDIDSKAKTATVRGRLIFDSSKYSPDFPVSQSGGSPRTFSLATPEGLPPAGPYWFGDYLTAGGYVSRPPDAPNLVLALRTYNFYPMWVEPDGTIRYTRVQVTEDTNQGPTVFTPNGPFLVIPPENWQPQFRPAKPSEMRPSGRERKLIRDYGKQRRETEAGIKCRRATRVM